LRRHAHAVWSRIDAEAGKSVHLAHSKQKLNDVSRDLFRDHGWTLPKGYQRHEARDPATYSLTEWQQCKRADRDPKRTKEVFQDAWAMSDSRKSFAVALKEHGLVLARGDRRGFVAMDHKGEAYAITRYCGLKAQDVRARLGKGDDLPSVSEAHREATTRVHNNLKRMFHAEKRRAQEEQRTYRSQTRQDADTARIAETRLVRAQERRSRAEETQRAAKQRRGFLGLVDWVTGRKKKIAAENQIEAEQGRLRDLKERQAQRAAAHHRAEQLEQTRKARLTNAKTTLRALKDDMRNLRAAAHDTPTKNQEDHQKRKSRRPRRGTEPPKDQSAAYIQNPELNRHFTQSATTQSSSGKPPNVPETRPESPDRDAQKETFKRKRRPTSERPCRRSRSLSQKRPTLDR